ncbi:MAG: glycosyl hydrolase family 28-related protein [Armatimonadota bacterium]
MVSLPAMLTMMVLAAGAPTQASNTAALVGQNGVYSVASFGAKGDRVTDDTKAFQKALDTAGESGGGIVFVPTGNYLIKTHLSIPENVTLEGVFRAPNQGKQYKGSTLLAVEGKGNADGTPFIMLNTNSTLKGINVFYPEQTKGDLKPYPWCVRGHGANCSIIDTVLTNPWQAVDFGTLECGRHYIKGLYSQPLLKGIFVDQCYDVGRIEDVHLWPFWDETPDGPMNFTRENGTAFIFGRTDWEFVSGCFCISYKTGFQFASFKAGPGNVILNNSGSDIGPCAVSVESSQGHAGIVFTNCQFMAGIDIKATNEGPVKFDNCGFWGYGKTEFHAKNEGSGQMIFNSCHFTSWDQNNAGTPAIIANNGGLIINACDFMESGKKQVLLGEKLKSAVIMANRMRGGVNIENKCTCKAQIGPNSEE